MYHIYCHILYLSTNQLRLKVWTYLSTYWSTTGFTAHVLNNSRLSYADITHTTPINSESPVATLLSEKQHIQFLLSKLRENNNSRFDSCQSTETTPIDSCQSTETATIHHELIPLAQLLSDALTQHLQLYIDMIDHEILHTENTVDHHHYHHDHLHDHHHHHEQVVNVTRAYMRFLQATQSMTR